MSIKLILKSINSIFLFDFLKRNKSKDKSTDNDEIPTISNNPAEGTNFDYLVLIKDGSYPPEYREKLMDKDQELLKQAHYVLHGTYLIRQPVTKIGFMVMVSVDGDLNKLYPLCGLIPDNNTVGSSFDFYAAIIKDVVPTDTFVIYVVSDCDSDLGPETLLNYNIIDRVIVPANKLL